MMFIETEEEFSAGREKLTAYLATGRTPEQDEEFRDLVAELDMFIIRAGWVVVH